MGRSPRDLRLFASVVWLGIKVFLLALLISSAAKTVVLYQNF